MILPLLVALALPLLSSDEGWDVEADRAPFELLEFKATEGTWISVDVAPDGEHIAFDLLGHIYEMPVAGGSARALTTGRSWNNYPRYSPDGSRLLFTSDRGGSNDLWVLTRATGELANVSKMDLPVFQGTWSRDGRHLYGTALNERVRFPAYRFNFHGTHEELVPAGGREPVNHFQEQAENGLVYFAQHRGDVYRGSSRIRTYDLDTGEIETVIDRPGGAAGPRLSPDGKQLAYVHRDDLQTVLVLHEIATRKERVICRTLDKDRLDSSPFYGAYPNLTWHPDGGEVLLSFGGGIQAVDIETGAARRIAFEAPVRRKLDATMRFRTPVPDRTTRTQSHRWGQRIGEGILFEALGDLYLQREGGRVNLTNSAQHETNPVFDARGGRIYYAVWDDDSLGSIESRDLAGHDVRRLTSVPSQYGSIALFPDDEACAYLRGAADIANGKQLERQTDFELVHRNAEGVERVVTEVSWTGNRYAKRPPTIRFSATGEELYFTEFEGDKLRLKRIRIDGEDERELLVFPHATRAVLSPEFQWVAFREYHRTFVTPFEYAGQVREISAADSQGYTRRVDSEDGDFTEWTADGSGLVWTRGSTFCEKSLADILAKPTDGAQPDSTKRTDLSFEFDVAHPTGTVAFTGVRVLTMDAENRILEGATVLIEDDRIVAVGTAVEIPAGARVFDLDGHTLMPGMFDAHGHYGSPISTLNVIEQRLYGLHANLAYGVTTMMDVYGTTQKDFWVSDMLRKGDIIGPRIYSVGDPLFVTKYRTKMHRSILSLDDAREHVKFNKDHGATAIKDYSNHTRAGRQQLAQACRELEMNLVTESFADPQMNLSQIADGFTGIEHTLGITPLYDDIRRLFVASDVGMTPTLIVVYNGPAGERYFHQNEKLWEDEKLGQFFRRDDLLRFRRPTHYWDDDFYHKEMAAELRKLHAAGVQLHMGAHGQMMGLGAHWEMELFVHGGFTPLEAIQIATINGFRHHGLDHSLGSIEPGKLADLVLLSENPLEDIRNTRSIRYVVKNGVVYSGKDAARVHPEPQPARAMYFKR